MLIECIITNMNWVFVRLKKYITKVHIMFITHEKGTTSVKFYGFREAYIHLSQIVFYRTEMCLLHFAGHNI